MPPEQARGEGHHADRRSDVYSLGVILFELLTGERPFRGNVRMLLHQVTSEEAPSPRKFNAAVYPDLETVCLKCLEKDPQRRYPTAAALEAELRRFLRGEPIEARPISRAARLWRWCKRKPAVAGLSAAVLMALATGTAVSTYFAVAATLSAQEAERERRAAVREGERASRSAEEQRVAKDDALRAKRGLETALSAERDAKAAAERAQRDLQEALASTRQARAAAEGALREQKRLVGLNHLREGSANALADRLPEAVLDFLTAYEAVDPSDPLRGTARLLMASWGSRLGQVLFHGASVRDVVLSPDGGKLATAGGDQCVRLWDAQTGAPLGAALRHDAEVHFVAFSPDGTLLVSGSGERTLRLWDVRTGEPRGPAVELGHEVKALEFGGTGRVVAADGGRRATLWDVGTGQRTEVRLDGTEEGDPEEPRRPPAVSPDGTRIAAGGDAVAVWDATTGRLLFPPRDMVPPEANSAGRIVGFSPDGGRLVVLHNTGVGLLDAGTGETAAELTPQGICHKAVASADGSRVVTASTTTGLFPNHVELWSADGIRLAGYEAEGTLPSVTAIAVSPDGRRFAAAEHRAERDSVIRVWDSDGTSVGEPLRHEAWVTVIRFGQDGETLVSASLDGTARLWGHSALSRTDGPPLALDDQHEYYAAPVALSPGGDAIATGGRSVRLWDAASRAAADPLFRHEGGVTALAYSPDGRTLAAGTGDGLVQLWDVRAGRQVGTTLGHDRQTLVSASFSADGRALLTVTHDGVRLWDAEAGTLLREPLRLPVKILNAALSPDGGLLAVACEDRFVRLFDAEGKEVAGGALPHETFVPQVTFSPDGTVLAACDGPVFRLWDVATRTLANAPIRDGRDTFGAYGIAFSPDGATIAVGGGSARLWDVRTGAPRAELFRERRRPDAGDPPWFYWTGFTADGKTLMTAGDSRRVSFWDVSAPDLPYEDEESVRLWAEVVTRRRRERRGVATTLSAEEWLERRTALEERSKVSPGRD